MISNFIIEISEGDRGWGRAGSGPVTLATGNVTECNTCVTLGISLDR